MKTTMKALALGLALGLAAPAFAGDTQDTVTEKKANARKTVRDLKPGDKTLSDHAEDASDTVKSGVAKSKKSVRKGARKVKHETHEATK